MGRRRDGGILMLFEHMTGHEFTTRFRWEPGSVALWDNRATAHIVPTDIPPGARRSVQRIALEGDLPIGPNGERSHALRGDAFQ